MNKILNETLEMLDLNVSEEDKKKIEALILLAYEYGYSKGQTSMLSEEDIMYLEARASVKKHFGL